MWLVAVDDVECDIEYDVDLSSPVMSLEQTTAFSSFRKRLALNEYRKKLIEELITTPNFAIAKASDTIRWSPWK